LELIKERLASSYLKKLNSSDWHLYIYWKWHVLFKNTVSLWS